MNTSPISPTKLRCEYKENPLGIDIAQPRLSWILTPVLAGQHQSAYQILVASSAEALSLDEGDLWDSGKVGSDQSSLIAYAGEALSSRQRAWWKVRVWDKNGDLSTYSAPAWWEMGLLRRDDWHVEWISLPAEKREIHGACPYLRRDFQVPKPIMRARAYASALGIYKLFVNGEETTRDCFLPGWTDYATRVQYQALDVTDLLKQGANAVGMILADGWYCGPLGFKNQVSAYAEYPEGLLQLDIEYADGTHETVGTDSRWRAATGPILTSTLYNGETYDARLEMPGWDQAGFDDSAWAAAETKPIGDIALCACASLAVAATEELHPRAVREPAPGVYVFDIGQNLVGWVRLTLSGKAGQTITLRFAEMLNPEGTIYTTNLRSAECTDRFTFARDGQATYEPSFTFHGFRYVEVTGCESHPALDAITAIVAHSNLPITGTFECSNTLLNQLQKNIVWGQRGNFLDVPTDCPQRDERLGWMGDAQIFVRTGCFNMDSAAFFTKWMTDVSDAQSADGGFPDVAPRIVDTSDGAPAWGDAGVIVPWTIYRCYGDKRILETHYDAMAKWVAYIHDANANLLWLNRRNNDFGDWLSINADTPKDVLATAYLARDADLMSRIAGVLGKEGDARRYEQLFDDIKTAFNKEYVGEDGRIKGDTQSAYVLALHFGLLGEERRRQAIAHLVEDIRRRGTLLSTGFLGTGHLLPALTGAGQLDLAYQLALSERFPSWGYSIGHGATTIWERWDGWTEEKGFQDPGMNSFNHYAFGAVGEWLYTVVAGIDLDIAEPGYKRFVLRPRPGGGLTWARAAYESPYGEIVSDWRIDGQSFRWRVAVPVNSSATAWVPAKGDVTINGRPAGDVDGIKLIRKEPGATVLSLVSGEYELESLTAG